MSVRYSLKPEAFREELLNAGFMEAEMLRRAEAGKAFAESISPDAPPLGEGYIASFEVESGKRGGVNHDRAYARLGNTSPQAPYVEHGNGTEKYRGEHVLTRTLDVMGA